KRDVNRLLDPLHPDNPKFVAPIDAAMWKARQLELGTVAALELSEEPARRDFWSKVLDRASSRYQSSSGDAKEGALALSARVAAALACLEVGRESVAVVSNDDLRAATTQEIQTTSLAQAPSFWSWSPELRCGWVRDR